MVSMLGVFSFAVTLLAYFGAKRMHARLHRWWSAPIFLVPVLLVLLLLACRIPYAAYWQTTHWLSWLLGPATVAFALPIWRHRALIARQWLQLATGVTVGVLVGVGSSVGLARLLDLPPALQHALAPRSISTPFALAAAPSFGGDGQLVAIFVVITGVVGMVLGEALLALVRVRGSVARGALFGAAAHGAGTAKASEIGQEEGVVASLTMMLCGVVTVLLAPMLAHLL